MILRHVLKRQKQRWLQFSLRFLLLLMALAAVGCWWFLRPESEDLVLVEGALKVRQQYRMGKDDEHIRSGRWLLLGRDGRVRAKGRYSADRPHAWWTAYHEDGNKAIQGRCSRGARIGQWQSWYSTGQIQTQWECERGPLPRWYERTIEVGLSSRAGAVRAWWPNGQVRFEGQYADDKEDGVWTYYDRAGRKTAKGPYCGGLRHGMWTLWDGPEGRQRAEAYSFGRPVRDLDGVLEKAIENLSSGDLVAKLAAAQALERLAPFSVTRLVEVLESSDTSTRLLAVRALGRIGEDAMAELPRVERLLTDPDTRVRLHAHLAVLLIDRQGSRNRYASLSQMLDQCDVRTIIDALGRLIPLAHPCRQAAYDRLIEVAANTDANLRDEALERLAQLDLDGLPLLEESLDHRNAAIRSAALDVVIRQRHGLPYTYVPSKGYTVALLERATKDFDPKIRDRAKEAMPKPMRMGGGFF